MAEEIERFHNTKEFIRYYQEILKEETLDQKIGAAVVTFVTTGGPFAPLVLAGIFGSDVIIGIGQRRKTLKK